MVPLRKKPLLELPDNVVQEIRKMNNLDKPGDIDKALDILVDWIKKQDHILKKDFDRRYLEVSLIAAKGSIEKTKKQIDRLCTLKTLLPHFFIQTNIKPHLEHIFDLTWLVVLPKVTSDFYRIFVAKVHGKIDNTISDNIFMDYFQYSTILAEYIKAHDYFNGFVVIYDFQQVNIMDLVVRLNPVQLQQYVSILVEGYGGRLKQIYLITQSKAIDVMVKMVKQFLSPKIADRLLVCKSQDELYSTLPRDLLPVDFGGKERSLREMNADWIEELCTDEHIEYMKMMRKACTNEDLRRPDHFNEEYLGMPGSFRNLTVD